MNIVFFVVLLLLLGGGVKGYKHGMIQELSSVISLVLALTAIGMFLVAAQGYLNHETIRIVLGIVCMTIAVLVYKIVDFILSSLKVISSLPVLKGVDKLLGFGVGAIEAVLIIWTAFLLIVAFDPAGVSAVVMEDVRENYLLTLLFQNNLLADVISGRVPDLSVIRSVTGGDFLV